MARIMDGRRMGTLCPTYLKASRHAPWVNR